MRNRPNEHIRESERERERERERGREREREKEIEKREYNRLSSAKSAFKNLMDLLSKAQLSFVSV